MKKKRELNTNQGKRLKECIEAKKMSQKELAKKSGYSEQYISYIANKKKNMSLESAKMFADILDVDAEYLLCETDCKNFTDWLNKGIEEEKERKSRANEASISLLKANGISIDFFIKEYHNKKYDILENGSGVTIKTVDGYDPGELDYEADEMLKDKVDDMEKRGFLPVFTQKAYARVQFEDEFPQLFEQKEIYRFVEDIIDFAEFQAERIRKILDENKLINTPIQKLKDY